MPCFPVAGSSASCLILKMSHGTLLHPSTTHHTRLQTIAMRSHDRRIDTTSAIYQLHMDASRVGGKVAAVSEDIRESSTKDLCILGGIREWRPLCSTTPASLFTTAWAKAWSPLRLNCWNVNFLHGIYFIE